MVVLVNGYDFQPRPVCRVQGAREQPARRCRHRFPSFVSRLGGHSVQNLVGPTYDEHPMRNRRVGLDPVVKIWTKIAITNSGTA
jgi:hypothetical protein